MMSMIAMPSGGIARLAVGIAVAVVAGLVALAPGAAFAAQPVHVGSPWFRFLLPSIPAAGYMRLENTADHAVVLTGAHSPACGMMMLHKTVSEHAMEKMVAVPSVTIPSHGQFTFRPGRYHIMCMRPKMKPGETVPVTLAFRHAPSVTVRFTVYGAKGKPAEQ